MLAWEQGRLDEAERDLAQAVAIWRTTSARTRAIRGMADHAQLLQAMARPEAAIAEIEQASQQAVAQLGSQAPAHGGDRTHPRAGAVVARQPLPARSNGCSARRRSHARRWARPAQRTQSIELSLAREQARDEDLRAIGVIERLAVRAPPAADGNEPRNLRWRARAYLGEVRCRGRDTLQARTDLDALADELHTGLPQGGRLPREVEAIRASCTPLAAK
jgi:serine/threonine-protein kinase